MIESGVCNFVACSLQVLQPLLILELVLAVGSPDPNVARNRALVVSIYVVICIVAMSLSQQRQMHLAMRAGQRMRATIVAEIFDVALRLTPAGKAGLSKGVRCAIFLLIFCCEKMT
jgi:ABC-type transport system involved in cytochrome bd biosynthesis fused ATPase/permease subunit